MCKRLLIIAVATMVLGGCVHDGSEPNASKNATRKKPFYKKVYKGKQADLLREIGDPNNLDSVDIKPRPVGRLYHDMFTKRRGRYQSSRYNPADF